STLESHTSTLTVLMDDVPIGSVKLDDQNAKKTYWRLDISHLNLGAGYHKLSFLAHMQNSNLACANPNNAANWVVLHADSSLFLNLVENMNALDLAWYPSPFFERTKANPLQTIFVVPDEMQEA